MSRCRFWAGASLALWLAACAPLQPVDLPAEPARPIEDWFFSLLPIEDEL